MWGLDRHNVVRIRGTDGTGTGFWWVAAIDVWREVSVTRGAIIVVTRGAIIVVTRGAIIVVAAVV